MRKKILIISNVTTGLVNFRKELLEALREQYDVIVTAADGSGRGFLEKNNCHFVNTDISRHGTNPIRELGLYRHYLRLLKTIRPDVVLTYTIKPNVYGGAACARRGVPYISNITGLGDAIENPGLLSLISTSLYKFGLRKAVLVFFQNKTNCDFFLRKRLYRGKYEVLPGSGVNLERHCFEPYPEEKPGEPLILSVVGRIVKDKGIEEILKASESFSGNNIIIQLIGSCEEDYLNQIREAEKRGVIRYIGQQNNIHEWMKNSHAILHASYHEGMSNVLLEAAACGRPVIATNVPGCADTFDEGVSGIGFEAKNADALVAAVERFWALPHEKKVAMGAAGRRKMEMFFDRKIVVNKYMEAIERALDA